MCVASLGAPGESGAPLLESVLGGLSRAQAQLKAADFGSGVVLPENQPLMGPQPWLGCGGGNQHPVFLQRPVGSQGEPWGADTILWFEAVQ